MDLESSTILRRLLLAALAALLANLASPASARADDPKPIPAHPDQLVYPPLEFEPPERADHRHVLPCGVVVYVVEDHALPLVDVEVLVRAGAWLEPAGKEGLAAVAGSLLRTGGTREHSPEEFDEAVDFLAAEISTAIGSTEGSASLNCLRKDLDRTLDLFFEMLRTPRFEASRLELARSRILQQLERRNDSTASIESREWGRLLRGPDHFSVERETRASIESITREDLLAFHARHVHPGNFIIAVSGDVETEAILGRLERELSGWRRPEEPPVPIPPPRHQVRPGVYLVDKKGVNQGRVSIGQLAPRRDDPDYHALLLMNHILGGGGFVSRITSRVRSDEGLAYTARSSLSFGIYYEGTFRAVFQSRSEAVARAIGIVEEEIKRIREELVSERELEEARSYWRGVFPRFFATPRQVASTLARDELTGRSVDHWRTFRQKLAGVTREEIRRVAREHLKPEDLVVLIVGDAGAIEAGDPDHPEASLSKIAGKAGVSRIPLPDPSTLDYGS